jgi:hypothetical protein
MAPRKQKGKSEAKEASSVPPFPADIKQYSDEELGKMLLDKLIGVEAERRGIPIDRVPKQFADKVIRALPRAEVSSAIRAPLEKAVHKLAKGDFAAAGRLIREHLVDGAERLLLMRHRIENLIRAAEMGALGAATTRAKGQESKRLVEEVATRILSKRKKPISDRELARKIAREVPLSPDTIRKILPKPRKEEK